MFELFIVFRVASADMVAKFLGGERLKEFIILRFRRSILSHSKWHWLTLNYLSSHLNAERTLLYVLFLLICLSHYLWLCDRGWTGISCIKMQYSLIPMTVVSGEAACCIAPLSWVTYTGFVWGKEGVAVKPPQLSKRLGLCSDCLFDLVLHFL